MVKKDSIRPKELSRITDSLAHFNRAKCLGKRCMFVSKLALVLQLRETDDHALARGDVADHLHQEVLNELEGSNWFPKLFASLCVYQCILIGAHLAPDSLPCDEAACHAEYSSSVPEGSVVLQTLLLGNHAVVEGDQSVLDHAQCPLVLEFFYLETRAI